MTVGELIALLAKCASGDIYGDDLLMKKMVYRIDVNENYIEISFVDGQTQDYALFDDGHIEYL